MLAGMCNSVMDTLFSHYDISIFKKFNPLFWNPEISWKNKWAQPYPQPTENKWYYFGFPPPYKERFPYSSTIFVFLTDAWHLFKFFMLTFIFLGVVLYTPIVSKFADFFIYYIAYTFTFTMFYDYVLVRKEYRD
jgi:hypothetical protein